MSYSTSFGLFRRTRKRAFPLDRRALVTAAARGEVLAVGWAPTSFVKSISYQKTWAQSTWAFEVR
jgi:hypothetical protein